MAETNNGANLGFERDLWRMADAHHSSQRVGGVSGAKIEQLATRLLAVWSGVYNSVDFPEQVPAIAAPGVIRLS